VLTGMARKSALLTCRSWKVLQKFSNWRACSVACCIRMVMSRSSDRVGTSRLPRCLNSLVQWTWKQSSSPKCIVSGSRCDAGVTSLTVLLLEVPGNHVPHCISCCETFPDTFKPPCSSRHSILPEGWSLCAGTTPIGCMVVAQQWSLFLLISHQRNGVWNAGVSQNR